MWVSIFWSGLDYFFEHVAVLVGKAVPALGLFVDDVHPFDDANLLILHRALELAQVLSELDE